MNDTIHIIDTGDDELLFIDEQDVLFWKSTVWSKNRNKKKNGFGTVYFVSRGKYFHREILNASFNEVADHEDGNTFNCTRKNLRLTTHVNSSRNVRKTSFKRTSKYKGVYWNSRANKWRAQIRINRNTRLHLGYFILEEDAAKTYDIQARIYHKEFACVNFPVNKERGALN